MWEGRNGGINTKIQIAEQCLQHQHSRKLFLGGQSRGKWNLPSPTHSTQTLASQHNCAKLRVRNREREGRWKNITIFIHMKRMPLSIHEKVIKNSGEEENENKKTNINKKNDYRDTVQLTSLEKSQNSKTKRRYIPN